MDIELKMAMDVAREDYIDRSLFPEDSEEQYLAFVEKQILHHPVVKVHHGKWKELNDWENGNQFSKWDADSQSLVPVNLRRRRKRLVINLMKPLAETIEGKINFMSVFQGVPNSSELGDIQGAQVSTKLLAHNDYINSVEALNEDMKYDLIRTGNSFRKWTWETGFNGTGKDGKPVEGELIGCVPSVFNIRPDPTAKTIEQCRWLIEIEEVSEDALLDAFPNLKKEDFERYRSDKKEHGSSAGVHKFSGMNEPVNEKDPEEPTYILAMYWERPTKRYPKGRYIMSIPEVVLWAKENPCLGEIPFFHFGYKRTGNSLWHSGPMHHVQDIQRDFNRMISIISEHVEGWRPKMVVDKGACLKEGSFTTDNFEILELDLSRGAPMAVQTPQISPEVMNHRDFLIGAKDMVSNVHEVSYSQLPQYATRAPASLYSQMVEQENMKIDPMIQRINRTLKREASFRLRMMAKYYKDKRLVKIVGQNERSSVGYFSGADLNGNYDVKLVIGVNIHQSKIIQQKMILDLKSAGAPIEWDTIMKLLWDGDISEAIRGDIADEHRADRENQAFMNLTYGRPFNKGGVQMLLTDNHEVHLRTHDRLAKSEEAQQWDKKVWDAFNKHLVLHMSLLQNLMQKQAAAMATTTTPPGGAAGSTPPSAMGGPDQSAGDMETQATEDVQPF